MILGLLWYGHYFKGTLVNKGSRPPYEIESPFFELLAPVGQKFTEHAFFACKDFIAMNRYIFRPQSELPGDGPR